MVNIFPLPQLIKFLFVLNKCFWFLLPENISNQFPFFDFKTAFERCSRTEFFSIWWKYRANINYYHYETSTVTRFRIQSRIITRSRRLHLFLVNTFLCFFFYYIKNTKYYHYSSWFVDYIFLRIIIIFLLTI